MTLIERESFVCPGCGSMVPGGSLCCPMCEHIFTASGRRYDRARAFGWNAGEDGTGTRVVKGLFAALLVAGIAFALYICGRILFTGG